MRYGCSQDVGGASGGNAERPQDQIDLDDLKMIITRFGRLPPLVAILYLCFDNIFFLRWMLLRGFCPAKMDGRRDLLHLIIYLEKH